MLDSLEFSFVETCQILGPRVVVEFDLLDVMVSLALFGRRGQEFLGTWTGEHIMRIAFLGAFVACPGRGRICAVYNTMALRVNPQVPM